VGGRPSVILKKQKPKIPTRSPHPTQESFLKISGALGASKRYSRIFILKIQKTKAQTGYINNSCYPFNFSDYIPRPHSSRILRIKFFTFSCGLPQQKLNNFLYVPP